MIFAVLVLLCAIDRPGPDCQLDTAIAARALSVEAEGLADCMYRGQVAASLLGWTPDATRYVKVRCTLITDDGRSA